MDYLEKAARVLDIEIFEIKRLRDRLGENFSRAVELIKETVDARGKVVVLGVGKSGHIGAKIAATLTSTGSPAVVLDSSNALHGDLGMVADGDVVLALKASTTSPSATMPRSPCRAFEESSTTAGDPVLVRVAAIFAPMCPDFPTPRTTTFPRASTASLISSMARAKFSPRRSRSRLSSKISISRTRAAFSR